jgi:hypothetical protein
MANMTVFTAVGVEAPEHGNALDYAWRGLLARRIAHLSGASNLGLRLGLPRDLSMAPLLVWLILGLRYVIWGPVGPKGGQWLVDGVSSTASLEAAESSTLDESLAAESSSVPNTRSSAAHATNVVPMSASSASTSTPRGKRET